MPLAYITCCIRVSSESSGRSVSLNLSGVPDTALAHAVTFRQSASGVGPAFCTAGSGTAYGLTVDFATCTLSAGATPELSDAVLVTDHVSRSLDVPVPLASSAAFVLRKYSVPLAVVAYCPAVGDCAGHTVKPGWSPGAARLVSIWLTVTELAPDASCALDIA